MVRTRGAGFTQRPECQQAEVCVRGPFWKACCLSPPPVVSRSAGVSCPDGADAYWVASDSAVWSGDASQLPEGPSHGRVQDSGVPGPDPFPMPAKQARTSSPWGVNGTLRSLERGRGPRESSRPPLKREEDFRCPAHTGYTQRGPRCRRRRAAASFSVQAAELLSLWPWGLRFGVVRSPVCTRRHQGTVSKVTWGHPAGGVPALRHSHSGSVSRLPGAVGAGRGRRRREDTVSACRGCCMDVPGSSLGGRSDPKRVGRVAGCRAPRSALPRGRSAAGLQKWRTQPRRDSRSCGSPPFLWVTRGTDCGGLDPARGTA